MLEEFNMLKLFDNATRSQIFWNLIVYKELSAGQLAKMLKKNISTITRNLEVMKAVNLIQVSKVKSKKNLQIKFWKINPVIFKEPSLVEIEKIDKLTPTKKKEVMIQLNNFLLLSQNIIQNILSHNLLEPEKDINLAMFLFDKKTGKLFEKKLEEFVQKFLEQYNSKMINIENLGLDTNIFFMIKSQIKDSVPLKEIN